MVFSRGDCSPSAAMDPEPELADTKMSRAREGLELVEGTRQRLYSKAVAGLGPGPLRHAGAMAEALCAPGRQGPKNRSEIQSNLLN